jgi:hypothetical protein
VIAGEHDNEDLGLVILGEPMPLAIHAGQDEVGGLCPDLSVLISSAAATVPDISTKTIPDMTATQINLYIGSLLPLIR